MKDHRASRHPGPMNFMRVDAELTGVFVAIGFALMLAVALPITKWFVLGTLLLGVLVAVGIRVFRAIHRSKSNSRPGASSGGFLGQ